MCTDLKLMLKQVLLKLSYTRIVVFFVKIVAPAFDETNEKRFHNPQLISRKVF